MSAECVDTCAHTCAAYVPSGLGCGFEEFRASPDAWAHKTWAASVDLYNESHLDSGDGERCWAIWTRAHPQPPARGQAGLMWYLLFPDVGLAIELAHGVGVSWDGRVHRHCTAVPRHVAPRDHLYALFLGQYTRVMNASERVAELRMALRAQVEARRRQRGPELGVGSVVWAKLYARGSGYLRAQGVVAKIDAEGVVWVMWTGERGPARGWWQPFERAVAGDVLVPAGFGPQPPPHLRGAQLVGQRVRVYWRKDDEFYSGTVVAYDATRDDAFCYQVRYDVDGELLWDELWDEERNAGFQLEGQGDDHARLGEGQGGSWESDEESEPLGQRAKRLRERGGERS
jgi:hypothetical protein